MNISAKTEYACLAMMELAAHYGSTEPVTVRDIAQRLGIPSRFLVQILLQLKAAGLVSSTRGAAGGYRLHRDPASICLWDILRLTEGSLEQLTQNAMADSAAADVLMGIWQEAAQREQELLSGISLANLLERIEGQAPNMYFI